MEHAYRVIAGIDWATELHEVWVTDAGGEPLAERQVPHRGAALTQMADWLIDLAGGTADAVAVAIETPHGPIVDTLLDRGCHVYAINPKQLDRFRDRFSASGAKDDRRDARVAASALRTDRTAFRQLHMGDPVTLELREISRQDDELREDLQRLTNRLRDLLLRVWPELLHLTPAANEPWFWTLLRYAPTPAAGQTLPVARVQRILREHHVRRLRAADVVGVLRAPSVYVAPGVREGVAPRIAGLVEQIWIVYAQRQQTERRLKQTVQGFANETPTENVREHHDVEILQSLPGIGIRITATMLAETAQLLQDRDYHGLRTVGGLAPVTKRSGKRRTVQMRYACKHRVRAAFFSWGMMAIQKDPHSRAHYDALRAKGHGHARALRGVVDRLLAVLVAMLKDRTLYDPGRRHVVQAAA